MKGGNKVIRFSELRAVSPGAVTDGVNSHSRSLYVVVRPSVCLSSVVCNVRSPYTGDWNFRQCFYTPFGTIDIHEKFYGDRPRGTPPSDDKRKRGSQI